MKTTNILKTAIYALIAFVLTLSAGCEEEKNKLPEYTIYLSPREDVGATQGDMVNIKVVASDSDGEVQEIALYIDEQMKLTETSNRLLYDWDTDYIDPKDYTIKVIVTDNGNGQSTEEIIYTVHGATPTVKFGSNLTEQLAGLAIEFTDSSTYEPIGWLWNFGDGNTSTEQNPTHVYTTGGLYTISLTATNTYGSETATKTDYITVVDTFVTDYDNNTYKVVKIGEQYWMAENLGTTHYADGTPLVDGTGAGNITGDYTTKYYFAYNDDENNVDIYGRLYTWAAVMNGAASSNSNPSGVQGACPDNWHVSGKAEWDELVGHLGGAEIVGGMLKESTYDYWFYPNTAASNESGFSALPAGNRSYSTYNNLGYFTSYWCSFESSNNTSYRYSLGYNVANVEELEFSLKLVGSSVRCVRD